MANKANQTRMDQVPTLTEKSSGIEFRKANMEPKQDSKVEQRENSTKNDKA